MLSGQRRHRRRRPRAASQLPRLSLRPLARRCVGHIHGRLNSRAHSMLGLLHFLGAYMCHLPAADLTRALLSLASAMYFFYIHQSRMRSLTSPPRQPICRGHRPRHDTATPSRPRATPHTRCFARVLVLNGHDA
jgi:hypothetical protein